MLYLLLLSLIISINLEYSLQFDFIINSPLNNSIIGKYVYIQIKITNSTLFSNEINDLELLVVKDNILVTNFKIESSLIEFILSDGIINDNKNIFQFILKHNNIVKSKDLILHSKLYIDDNLNSIINMSRSNVIDDHLYSYLMIGINNDLLNRMALLEAKRIELYYYYHIDSLFVNNTSFYLCDNDSEIGSDKYQLYNYVCTVKLLHIKSDLRDLISISYVDNSFITLDVIIEHLVNSNTYQITNIKIIYDHIGDIIRSIIQLTRNYTWIFLDKDAAIFAKYDNLKIEMFIEVLKLLKFRQIYFNKEDNTNELNSDCVYNNVIVFVYKNNINNDNNDNDNNPLTSSIKFESYLPTRSHILLTNACIISQKHDFQNNIEVVIFNNQSDNNLINISNLAEEEDRGFEFTGLRVKEYNLNKLTNEDQVNIYKLQRLERIKGMTGLSLSVQKGHIIHEMEPIIQLLSIIRKQIIQKKDNILNLNKLDLNYKYISNNINKIIFGSLTHNDINDWIVSMFGLIMKYYNNEKQLLLQDNNKHVFQLLSPKLYLFNHLFKENNFNYNINGYCFDELLLLGRSNNHVGFYGSTNNISLIFKEFIYNEFDIPLTFTLSSLYNEYNNNECNIDNNNNNLPNNEDNISIRDIKLKITICIRPGPEREILNLVQVVNLLKTFKFVDKYWLDKHVITFDELSFINQVNIMSKTDIYISLHGASIFNGIFMRENSVVIDILQARFIEYVFQPSLKENNIKLLYLKLTNQDKYSKNCPYHNIPQYCYEGYVYDENKTDCWYIR
jgi:hypothetical protein